MSDEQNTPEKDPNIAKDSGPGPSSPKKKNPLLENFTNKLGKVVDALAQEEKDINAFSEAGIELKKFDTKAIKNIGKSFKGKVSKKTESKPSEKPPEEKKSEESDSSDQEK